MAGNFMVFIEVREGRIKRSSFEAAGEAKRLSASLGAQVGAVIVGHKVKDLAPQAGAYGVSKIYVVDDPRLGGYSPEGYARAVLEASRMFGADKIFFAATAMGKDVAAGVAALTGVSAATDCTAVTVQNGDVLARRPVYAGKAYLTLRFRKFPIVLSLRPNVFSTQTSDGTATVQEIRLELSDADLKTRATGLVQMAQGKVELTEATTVVSGGRGLKGPENFHLRDDLATVLGAACGASRAVVDAGWRPHSEQVGQTGKTVSPNLYIALGISGAIQHLAGMSSSKVIVAINKDPEAPIFKVATYGIVGDVFEVAPVLTEHLKKVLAP